MVDVIMILIHCRIPNVSPPKIYAELYVPPLNLSKKGKYFNNPKIKKILGQF